MDMIRVDVVIHNNMKSLLKWSILCFKIIISECNSRTVEYANL